jgi:hypothetical protein
MPKLDEDDFVDPGNLPQIAQSKTPPPGQTATSGSSSGFGFSSASGGFGQTAPSNFASAPASNTSAQAAGAMHSGGESTVKLDKDAQDWINKKWRPVMGWVYMLTCTMDFVIFPILWSVLQAIGAGQVTSQWNPITLQGAGLYHIAMGAVLGIAAYGRTKEKVEGKAS